MSSSGELTTERVGRHMMIMMMMIYVTTNTASSIQLLFFVCLFEIRKSSSLYHGWLNAHPKVLIDDANIRS